MKKVLILTVTAGNGHNACAKGVKEKLEKMGDFEVKVVDLLKVCATPHYVWLADKGYTIAVSKFLPIYNLCFEMYSKIKPEQRYNSIVKNTCIACCEKLLKLIYEFQPDIIYGSHFYAGITVTFLRLAYNIPCRTIVSTLDYANSPFWESAIGIDYLTIPNNDFTDVFIKEGFAREQLVSTGLPCGEQFLKEEDKFEARRTLGLDEHKFTILVMFGGGYWNGGYKIFKELVDCVKDKDVQIIMINGKNEQEYQKVEKLKEKMPEINIINVGFTNQVALYMSAADIILNKMGGVSSTEALNKCIPCIVTTKLPGQEILNLKYFEEKGIAKSFKNKKELQEALDHFMKSEEAVSCVKQKMCELKENGIENVANLIALQPNTEYNKEYISMIDYDDVTKNIRKALRLNNKIEHTNKELKLKYEKNCRGNR